MLKHYRIIFADLDGTLIETHSGETFAKDAGDFHMKMDVMNALRKMKNDGMKHLFIVSNQGGIPEYITEQDFEAKMSSIRTFMSNYLELYVAAKWCASTDKDNPRRKPNTGMLEEFWSIISHYRYKKDDCLMIGDASGKPGDFSDSDKKTAENFGIDYLDVNEFVELYG